MRVTFEGVAPEQSDLYDAIARNELPDGVPCALVQLELARLLNLIDRHKAISLDALDRAEREGV